MSKKRNAPAGTEASNQADESRQAQKDYITKQLLGLVPSLKGAAASIFLVLCFSDQPFTGKQLCSTTRYSDKPITQGINILKVKGLIRHSPRGWELSCGSFEVVVSTNRESELLHPYGNIPSTTTAINIPEDSNKAVVVKPESRKNSVIQALNNAQIFGTTAEELAELEHVTVDYINAQAAYCKRVHKETGILINRIRNNESIPALDKKNTNPDDDRHKYTEGDYGEYVQH